jgi:hypothetical protein
MGCTNGERGGRQCWEQPTSSNNPPNQELPGSHRSGTGQAVARSATAAVLSFAGNSIASSFGGAARATASGRGETGLVIGKRFPRSDDPMALAVAIPVRVFAALIARNGIFLRRCACRCRTLRCPADPR